MKVIDVKTSTADYSILLGKNIVSELRKYIEIYDKILILSNEEIGKLYFEKVLNELADERVVTLSIPEGERYKTLETLNRIYEFMALENFSRKSLIVSLGGGVVCDIGGFVGATYMRGIDFIQMPTSLLAQVDASIGGKTAVDHECGKNLIGVFKQPKLVVIDIEFLKTLPEKEFLSGMGEVIKHSLIAKGSGYFEFLVKNREGILNQDSELLLEMVELSCQIKRDIVQKDEFETGDRALLNLGHTYAHALEKLFNFENISHGEAVAKGIMFELELSRVINGIDKNFIVEVESVFKSFGIVSNPISYPEKALLEAMKNDKKNSFGKINFILFNREFEVYRAPVEIDKILEINNSFKNRYIKGVIDIGTNSCRLFLAQVYEDKEIKIEKEIVKLVEIVKLGEDVNKNGYLKREAIERTVNCLRKYRDIAQKYGTSKLYAFATSATRDSENRDEFLEKVRALNIQIECIRGEEEAQLNFSGNSLVFKNRILVLDIGGGSTEFTLGEKGRVEFAKSINIGAVRGTEMFFSNQEYSKESINSCKEWIKKEMAEVKFLQDEKFLLVGVAGTATTQISVMKKMEVYDSSKVHLSTITLEELDKNLKLFLSKDELERKDIVGLEEKRADVIVAGTLILITIMEELGVASLTISESDNLNGAMIKI